MTAQRLARDEDFDSLALLVDHFSFMRRYAPTFLETFEFHGAPIARELLAAVDVLREMTRLTLDAERDTVRYLTVRYLNEELLRRRKDRGSERRYFTDARAFSDRIGKYQFLKENVRFTIQNVKAGVNR